MRAVGQALCSVSPSSALRGNVAEMSNAAKGASPLDPLAGEEQSEADAGVGAACAAFRGLCTSCALIEG